MRLTAFALILLSVLVTPALAQPSGPPGSAIVRFEEFFRALITADPSATAEYNAAQLDAYVSCIVKASAPIEDADLETLIKAKMSDEGVPKKYPQVVTAWEACFTQMKDAKAAVAAVPSAFDTALSAALDAGYGTKQGALRDKITTCLEPIIAFLNPAEQQVIIDAGFNPTEAQLVDLDAANEPFNRHDYDSCSESLIAAIAAAGQRGDKVEAFYRTLFTSPYYADIRRDVKEAAVDCVLDASAPLSESEKEQAVEVDFGKVGDLSALASAHPGFGEAAAACVETIISMYQRSSSFGEIEAILDKVLGRETDLDDAQKTAYRNCVLDVVAPLSTQNLYDLYNSYFDARVQLSPEFQDAFEACGDPLPIDPKPFGPYKRDFARVMFDKFIEQNGEGRRQVGTQFVNCMMAAFKPFTPGDIIIFLDPGGTAGDLKTDLVAKHPEVAPAVSACAVARDAGLAQ